MLFMKGFLQLIAQFSSNLFAAWRLLNVTKMSLHLRVSSDVTHGQYFKRQNDEVVLDKGKSSYLK